MKIQALETRYAGHVFRSRLEARWAMFFDLIGIKWEYEPEGYRLSNGECYLPDFWLPRFNDKKNGTYVEVKSESGDFYKACRFALELNVYLIEAKGLPTVGPYDVWHPDHGELWDAMFNEKYLPGGKNWDEYRMYWGETNRNIQEWINPRIAQAALDATSHRFTR